MKVSLRTKLSVAFLMVITICSVMATLVGIHFIGVGVIREAQERVKLDINSAREIYREKVDCVYYQVGFTAERFFIKEAILAKDVETLRRELSKIREREALDVLTLTDHKGKVVVRARNPSLVGDGQSGDPLVSWVMSKGEGCKGSVIVSSEELMREDAALVSRANIEYIPTLKARPRREREEKAGMMIKAAAPVLGYDGRLLGVLYGGCLLNRDYEMVDKVKRTVYQNVKYKGKDIGTATIFQDDLRISTNVINDEGGRAIGTRVSREVYEQVVGRGLPWVQRAYVVNDWYITAYEPIRGFQGNIIGMLYVGVLEEKYVDIKERTVAAFIWITIGGMIIALVVAGFLYRGISGKLKRLVYASDQWARGNFGYRARVRNGDELGKLGETFDSMATSLQERDERLKEYTEQKIMKSERLATIGQLAAGVAHEINNPLTGIMTSGHLLLKRTAENDPQREDLETIVQQSERCKKIIRGLLDFARETETEMGIQDIAAVLKNAIKLVESQVFLKGVKITCKGEKRLPVIVADGDQLQQVFINVMINALEAMDHGGELVVSTKRCGNKIRIEFQDDGCGVAPENLDRLFDPFFSTKEVGVGTGLGLAISYGIIEKHYGRIKIKSKQGAGTTVVIEFPAGSGRGNNMADGSKVKL